MKSGIKAIFAKHKWMKKGSKGLEIRHKWMKSGAKLHSFIWAIVGCSLANIYFRKMRGTNKSQK
jgi:hypothetical protein